MIRNKQLAAIELSQLATVWNKTKHQHLIHAFRPYVDLKPSTFKHISKPKFEYYRIYALHKPWTIERTNKWTNERT